MCPPSKLPQLQETFNALMRWLYQDHCQLPGRDELVAGLLSDSEANSSACSSSHHSAGLPSAIRHRTCLSTTRLVMGTPSIVDPKKLNH